MSYQKVILLIQEGLSLLIDSLFPRYCYGCGRYDTWLCVRCSKLLLMRSPVTTFNEPTHQKGGVMLDSVTAPLLFKVPLVSALIHDWKFKGMKEHTSLLAPFILKALENTPLALPHIITSVPLHPKRLRDRGYNQSELIAQAIVATLNTPYPIVIYQELLSRARFTQPQSKQPDRKARLTALVNAFVLKDPSLPLNHQIIWLIDDVTTTGATLEACAQVLKQAGAKEVHGIVIAR